jgi:hypothetical protein
MNLFTRTMRRASQSDDSSTATSTASAATAAAPATSSGSSSSSTAASSNKSSSSAEPAAGAQQAATKSKRPSSLYERDAGASSGMFVISDGEGSESDFDDDYEARDGPAVRADTAVAAASTGKVQQKHQHTAEEKAVALLEHQLSGMVKVRCTQVLYCFE